MLRKFAAAIIAVSLIAGPALAQGNLQGTAQGTAQGNVNTPAGQTSVKANTKTVVIKKHAHKAGKAKMHVAKVKHVKHVKHVKKHIKHVKQVKHLKRVKAYTTGKSVN